MAGILRTAEILVTEWQATLGDQVTVALGGSLVSGLFILDEQTKVIDMDVKFLVDDPSDESIRRRIEAVTGLSYRKTIRVFDHPSGDESLGVMVEDIRVLPGLPLPLEIEGCIRNRAYVGWARFYRTVFTPEELEAIRQQKIALRGDKVAYKQYKHAIVEEAKRRVLAQGLL